MGFAGFKNPRAESHRFMSTNNFHNDKPHPEPTDPTAQVDFPADIQLLSRLISVGLAPWPSQLPEQTHRELCEVIRKERQQRFLRLVAKAIALDLAASSEFDSMELDYDQS